MPWQPNFKKGADILTVDWLSAFPDRISYHGTANTYDGKRYMYWAVQHGSTASSAGTSTLWRFCTITETWQHLANLNNGSLGMEIEYDGVRNVLVIVNGASASTWQVFNLNMTAVTFAGVACQPWVLTNMTVALPVVATSGASITMPDDLGIPATIDTGTVDVGTTTTTVVATDATGTFGSGMVGLEVRFTSGGQSGQTRIISSVTNKNTLVLSTALAAAPAAGDAFVIELPSEPVTSASTTTLTDAGVGWTVNMYANSDVVIVSGTGAGQRRRIASNTVDTLTLAAAVTGNARTGPFTTTPDATSVYRIVPSSDFIYYQPGGSNALHRLDIGGSAAPTWTTLATSPGTIGGAGNTFHPKAYAPFQLMAVRGAATKDIYQYNIGLNTWATLPSFWGVETINTGASVAMMHGQRALAILKDGTTRVYSHNLLTGVLEPLVTLPYANGAAYDGKRLRYIETADGVKWLYALRPGGQEHYRIALEHLA